MTDKVSNLSRGSSKHAAAWIQTPDAETFFISPPKPFKEGKDDSTPPSGCICPYWLVKEAEDAEWFLDEKQIKVGSAGHTCNLLTNVHPIPKGAELTKKRKRC